VIAKKYGQKGFDQILKDKSLKIWDKISNLTHYTFNFGFSGMKLLPFIKILVVFAATTVSGKMARADHITGGEMYYIYAGMQGSNHVYRVTLRLLMRCGSGRLFPNPIIIGVFNNEGGARVADVPVPLASQIPLSLTTFNPCISNPPNVCFEVATYNFDVALPSNQRGYTLTAQVNYRVNGLANLAPGTSGIGATYTAEIPGLATGTGSEINSSAQFTGSDLVIVCASSPFTYSFQATDADGDVLRYSFCAGYETNTSGGGGQPMPPLSPPYSTIPYASGFDGTIPLGDKVSINPNTGLISGIAPASGTYVVSVCVEEIRNGRVIATQRKDIQLNITGCTVAAALLQNDYLLCSNTDEMVFENLSLSPLIQTYSWRLFDGGGRLVATSSFPKFVHRFADSGTYRVFLNTNVGQPCPDSTSSIVRVYPGMRPQFNFLGLCYENPTQYNDVSTVRYGTITERKWDLGEMQNVRNTSSATNPSITYLTEGPKTVKLVIYNSNGCRDSISRQLVISKEPPMQLAFKDTLICPPDTLRLQAFGDGEFTWSPAEGLLDGGNTSTPRVAPLVTTLYPVLQRQGNCIARDTIRVQVTQSVNISAMADTTICTGDEIRLLINSNALQYQWTPAATLNNPTMMQPLAKPQTPTNYRVVASISKCSATANVNILTVPYPSVVANAERFICFGASTQLNSQYSGETVQWSPAASLSDPTIPNPIASPNSSTTYTVLVFENKGCPKPGVDTVRVIVEPPINLAVIRDTSVVVGQPLTLNASGASRYLWSPGNFLSNNSIPNPVFTFTQPSEGLTYQVLGYNDAGCRDSLTVRITVYANGPTIYVPTAFTPNGDGLNETLKPTLTGMRQLNFFRVFNRYGEIVFQTSSLYDAWDGRYKGQPQASGTFVWMVQAVDFEGKTVQQKGSTMLMK
jgi:gliding motility-associated-like protein